MAAKVDPATGYYWYYKDHLGSTRQLGSSNLFRDYYPFGMSLAENGTETAYLFARKELDYGIGLSYSINRYLDQRIVQKSSSFLTNISDNTSAGLVVVTAGLTILQPEIAPATIPLIITASGFELFSAANKTINKITGSDEFSTVDIISDVSSVAIGTVGATNDAVEVILKNVMGQIVDEAIDNLENKQSKNQETNTNISNDDKKNNEVYK
jgi:hypothetical protein